MQYLPTDLTARRCDTKMERKLPFSSENTRYLSRNFEDITYKPSHGMPQVKVF
jgi:hypothetical protein